LGRHLAERIEAERSRGMLAGYYAGTVKPGDEGIARAVRPRVVTLLRVATPVRFSRGWSNFLAGDIFDRAVAAQLDTPCESFLGFAGKSLRSFERARELGAERLILAAPNSHVRRVESRHAAAYAQHGVESSWMNAAQIAKTLREYEKADVIEVNSEYTRNSFLEQGVAEAKLERTYLTPHPRFQPSATRPEDGRFRVVYIGPMTTLKGVPELLDAFARLSDPDAELVLMGGPASRPGRKHFEPLVKADPRIVVAPGDPLPRLQAADVCAHPSWEDGFGYAVAEAMACRVPVIVTENTGAMEYVREGINGYVIETGDADQLYERLVFLHEHRLRVAPADVPEFSAPSVR
jgi:glycosyltransferase involved in cell wall biosynthesis